MSVEGYERVADPPAVAEPEPPRSGRRPWWRRKPVKRSTIWVHRWSAMVLGLAMLVVTTSGVPLIYQEEIVQASHSSAYEESGGPRAIDHAGAYAAVQQHDPEFAPFAIYYLDGVYVADDFETRRVTVDPSTGEILGDFTTSGDDGFVPWAMSLMFNLHVCGLSCEGYVGYQAWLAEPVPTTGWAGFEGEPVTWGYLILGITGVLLLFLSLSGIWLWWPGIKRWFVGIRVRWRKGRYARDYDLHQVAGMIAIPLFLLWAVTGMGYSFGFVESAWYAVTPGDPPGEERFLESTESDEPDIGVAAAVAAATKTRGEAPISVDIPAEDDPLATYGVWFQDGIDPYGKAVYPGDYLISVDRKTGETMSTYGDYGSKAEELWSDWNFPLHSGWALNAWVRIIWVVLGLVPLLLAVTGLSTWFFKRGLRKRRARRLAAAA